MTAVEQTSAAPERRPAIVAVDDDPVVLAAVARDLRRGFGERYRILRAASGGTRSRSSSSCVRVATRSPCCSPTSACR